MKTLAIIPARGGSKGVPGKNIKMLAGKPLIAWTIETAFAADCLDRVVVSTDAPEIRDICVRYGAEAPFLRPKAIAEDDTSDLPVYQHALQWLEDHEGYRPEIIVWLRPTAPLRTASDIEGAVERLVADSPDWVRSVCEVEHHPFWMYRLDGLTMLPFQDGIDIRDYCRRQLLPPVYRINGAVDVAWRKTIAEEKLYCGRLEAYVMPASRSIDIDTEMDFVLAETILERGSK